MEPIENIEQYLRNELTVEQKKFFEYRMEGDPDLFQQVELHRKTMRSLDNHFLRELKEGMQQMSDDVVITKAAPKEKYNIFQMTKIMLAAGLLLILASVFLWMNRPESGTDLYLAYHEAYPNIEQPIQRADENTIFEGLVSYEAGDFSKASSALKAQALAEPDNPAWPFYLGNCALELDQPEQAITAFQKTINLGESKYINPARWYLALTYLKSDQREKAETYLRKLVEEDYGYRERAEEILSK